MADTTTHSIFSLELLNSIPNKKIIKKHLDLYKLGSQGPDPFFYLPKSYANSNIGGRMHEEHTGEFLIKMMMFARKSKSESLRTFVYGLINHFSLDSNVHPYVFFVTGVYDKNDTSTYKYRGQHLLLERTIDNLLIERKLKKRHRLFNVFKFNLGLKGKDSEVEKAISFALKETFGIDDFGPYYFEAFDRMKRVFKRVALDRSGLKRKLLSIYDGTVNKKGSIMYQHLSYKTPFNKSLDYLNEGHNTWYHPATNQASVKSFLDLYDDAKVTALSLIIAFDEFYDNKITESDLEKYFKNISYSSGLENVSDDQFKYFGEIFKK